MLENLVHNFIQSGTECEIFTKLSNFYVLYTICKIKTMSAIILITIYK